MSEDANFRPATPHSESGYPNFGARATEMSTKTCIVI